MFFTITIFCLIVVLLVIIFLYIVEKKKETRNKYFQDILKIYKNFKYEKGVRENKFLLESNSKKSTRIQKLEDLIYGSGKKLVQGGIQLPPLDLTNSGIFSLKR